MNPTIDIRGLSVRLGDTEAVGGLDAAAASGEWLALVGPNGAGKTTVLRAVAGLVAFTGSIDVNGHAVNGASRRHVARRVAFVPQTPETPGELTVAEYVLLGRTAHVGYFGVETRADRVAAGRAIELLDVGAFVDRSLSTLSGGERQRVVLARALAQEAPVLLLDEPTSALDLGRQQFVLDLVDDLRRRMVLTVIAAMHDLTLAGQCWPPSSPITPEHAACACPHGYTHPTATTGRRGSDAYPRRVRRASINSALSWPSERTRT
jgi:iron complex transport system ATP-binding protein